MHTNLKEYYNMHASWKTSTEATITRSLNLLPFKRHGMFEPDQRKHTHATATTASDHFTQSCSAGQCWRTSSMYISFGQSVINRTLAAEHSPLQLDFMSHLFIPTCAVTCTFDGHFTRASCMTGKLDCPCRPLWHQHTQHLVSGHTVRCAHHSTSGACLT